MSIREAFDQTVEQNGLVRPVDSALVETGRTIATRIDDAVEYGEGQEITKALYLAPHLVNILRELMATPAARNAAGVDGKEDVGGKLAQLRSVHGGKKRGA